MITKSLEELLFEGLSSNRSFINFVCKVLKKAREKCQRVYTSSDDRTRMTNRMHKADGLNGPKGWWIRLADPPLLVSGWIHFSFYPAKCSAIINIESLTGGWANNESVSRSSEQKENLETFFSSIFVEKKFSSFEQIFQFSIFFSAATDRSIDDHLSSGFFWLQFEKKSPFVFWDYFPSNKLEMYPKESAKFFSR